MANQQGNKNNSSTGNNQYTDQGNGSQGAGTGGRDQRQGQPGQGQTSTKKSR